MRLFLARRMDAIDSVNRFELLVIAFAVEPLADRPRARISPGEVEPELATSVRYVPVPESAMQDLDPGRYRESRSPRSRSADPGRDGQMVDSWSARLVGERTAGMVGRVRGADGSQRWIRAVDLRAKEGGT
jgi:hypothetical protein